MPKKFVTFPCSTTGRHPRLFFAPLPPRTQAILRHGRRAGGNTPFIFATRPLRFFPFATDTDGADDIFMTDGTGNGLFTELSIQAFMAGPGSCIAPRGPGPQAAE